MVYSVYIAIFYAKRLYFYHRITKITIINRLRSQTTDQPKQTNNTVS